MIQSSCSVLYQPGFVQAVRFEALVEYREGEKTETGREHSCNDIQEPLQIAILILDLYINVRFRTPSCVYVEPVEEEVLDGGPDPE